MNTKFFDWNDFREQYQLADIPEIMTESCFCLDLERKQALLSQKLAVALYKGQESCKGRHSFGEMKAFLSEQSEASFGDQLRRMLNGKMASLELQIVLRIQGDEIPALLFMNHIEESSFVLGRVHICYEMQREFKQSLSKVIGQLEQVQQINQLILEGSTDYIYQLDVVNNVCTFSPKAMEVLPLETPTFGNAMDRLLSFILPEDRSVFLESFAPFLSGKSCYHTAEYRVLTKQNTIMWISCHGKGMFDEQGRPVMIAGSLMDVTEQKKAEESIRAMLRTDILTGLKNRYCYEEEMAAHMKRPNAKGCIVCIDIRDFKLFNEIFGHNFGNRILKDFASMIQTYLPRNKGIYRLEGDEFLIHLDEDNQAKILEMLAPLQVALKRARIVDNHSIYIDATIGIALYPENGATPDELLKNADTVLYKMSKYSNEKIMFFKDGGGKDLSKRYNLENELRADIEKQFQHFRVVYQPIVKLGRDGNYWCAAEALLRYENPALPDVKQMELIETLEVTDLIIPVGRWVLGKAIEECSQWNHMGADASVHVNFSAQQVSDAGIQQYIMDMLEKHHLRPEKLICELTETSLINNFDTATNLCRDLMKQGIGIALDDFGTGYSSFNYMRTLPISCIKIDKAFVDNLAHDDYNRIIISCLYNLCCNMNMTLCVEGVESKETLDILSGIGVAYIQGFFFERPLEATTIRGEIAQHIALG